MGIWVLYDGCVSHGSRARVDYELFCGCEQEERVRSAEISIVD